MHSWPSSDVVKIPNTMIKVGSTRILEPGNVSSLAIAIDEIFAIVVADDQIIQAIVINVSNCHRDRRIKVSYLSRFPACRFIC